MKIFYSDIFELPLPPEHRFPMAKYRLLRDRVEGLAGKYQLSIAPAPPATDDQLVLVHQPEYLHRVTTGGLSKLEVRRIGFPWSDQLVERSRRSTGGTIAAARAACVDGIGVNLAGGTHHAFADRGQGYCVFNDVAVAIRVLRSEQLIQRAVVVDCDVHQGNGTAAIFAGENDVFTFSMHGERNFPFAKFPSDCDVALPDATTDAEYLARLREALQGDVPLGDADCVFYLAGADAYEHDRLGRLKLTRSGLQQRDQIVISSCGEQGVPLVIVMAGGYAAAVEDIVEIHTTTVRLAAEAEMASGESVSRSG